MASPSYPWNPADYHRSSPAQARWAAELIAKLGLTGRERLLDIGCGDGQNTAAIAAGLPGGSVCGADSSADMIAFACRQFPKVTHPNLSFMIADASALPFTGAFDIVFSNAALHWISDHGPVLAGIRDSLRPGGRMVIQMGGKGNAGDMFAAFDRLVRDPAWGRYFTDFSFRFGFYGADEYRGWIAAAGLEPARIETFPRDMTYTNREDFGAWIRTTWLPWMVRIPADARQQFIGALIDEYLRVFPADDAGVIHVRMVRLEAEARKPA